MEHDLAGGKPFRDHEPLLEPALVPQFPCAVRPVLLDRWLSLKGVHRQHIFEGFNAGEPDPARLSELASPQCFNGGGIGTDLKEYVHLAAHAFQKFG